MLYGKQADLYLPISFEDTFDESQIFEKEYQGFTLLFVGSLFGPNIEGITWFSKEVMSKLPTEIQLIVVGKGLETKKNQIERENVEVIGTVDDVGEYYYKADAVIIPIFYGDGMKVKTAEALMYGKELFASNEALEGYSVERIPEVHRCNTADDFINAICGVMEKKEKKKYYKSVRDIFLQNYETNRLKNSLEEFLSDMVDKGCQYAD